MVHFEYYARGAQWLGIRSASVTIWRLLQLIGAQCLIIQLHQHFELCNDACRKCWFSLASGFGEILHRFLVDRTWLHSLSLTEKAPASAERSETSVRPALRCIAEAERFLSGIPVQ